MAFIPWPNSIKVVLEFVIAGLPVTVTIAVTKPSALASGDVASVANTIRTWAITELMPDLSNDLDFTRCTAYDMTSVSGQVVVDTTGLPVGGGIAVVPVDIGSALDVSFRTANRGRSGRGRNYVPGIPGSQRATESTFSTTATGNMGTDYGNLSTYLGGIGFDHTVASEQLNLVARNPAVMQSVITYIGNIAIANQRKRGLWS